VEVNDVAFLNFRSTSVSPMRFPQTFIDDLRRQADIVRVVQDYVKIG
jgi:hypothetical protein